MAELEIRNLYVRAGEKEILRGLDLTVGKGQIHALMGPNGSGKSTLANVIMGHPGLEITDGQIIFKGEDITKSDPDERARMGLFMAFQYPVAVPGVTVTKYLRTVLNAHREARGEEPIALKDIVKSRLWTRMQTGNVYEFHSAIFQPVGGMDRVPAGFLKKIGHLVQYHSQVQRIRVLDKGVSRPAQPGNFTQPPMSYRYGDILVPFVAADEPLGVQDRHFVDCIRTGATPLTDGANGLAVVEVLEAAQLSLRLGRPVPLYELAPRTHLARAVRSVHPDATGAPALALVGTEAI